MSPTMGSSSMEVFLIVMAILVLMLLMGGLYLLRDRAQLRADGGSSSFLARILLAENEALTRLDLERNVVAEERWKCLVCEFSNALDRPTCVLCGTKRNEANRRESNVIDLEEMRLKRSMHRLSSASAPQGAAANNLRLSMLNPRQQYARKRHEWVRHVGPDGTAQWTRKAGTTNTVAEESDVSAMPSTGVFNPRASIGFVITARRNHHHTRTSSADSTAIIGADGTVTLPLPSSGSLSSSLPLLGRLTFAESSRADAAAATLAGYRLPPDELELISHVGQLPFPRKYTWFLERMARLLKSWEEGRIKLRVHRANVLVESMEQLLGIQREHLHFPLRIEFVGEVGIDAGGLQREWYSLLFTQLLDDSLGLFMECGSQHAVAINPNSVECTADHLLYFRGIGRLIGRALLEGQTMPARLCLPILKHFLGVPITFSDLQYVDPEVYRSLTWLRDMEDDGDEDLVADLELTFSVTELQDDGSARTIDLVPDGRNKLVTRDNKLEFLHLKLRYIVLDRYAEQLQALSLGLFEVVPQESLMVFDYQELELVLCGLPEIDLADWRKNTVVQPQSFADTPVVGWFWDILEYFEEDERARMLQFCTGSSRVPVQGFRALTSYDGRICPFTLRPLPHQSRGFPRVHTCFNRVELPLYETKKELEDAMRALLAMEWTEFSEE